MLRKLGLLAILMTVNINVKSDDLSKLTQALYFEDAIGPPECREMIAHVIMNRVNKKNWKNTITEVINAPAQFSYMHDGKPEEIDDWDKYIEFARISSLVMYGLIPDNTDGADHYINHNISRKTWWKSMTFVGSCGDHSFYRRDYR